MQFYPSPSEQVKATFNRHLEEEGKPDRDPAESLPGRRKGWARGRRGRGASGTLRGHGGAPQFAYTFSKDLSGRPAKNGLWGSRSQGSTEVMGAAMWGFSPGGAIEVVKRRRF